MYKNTIDQDTISHNIKIHTDTSYYYIKVKQIFNQQFKKHINSIYET